MHYTWTHYIAFSIAAMGGAFARYALTCLCARWCAKSFPWGIFITNILGCFFFGLVWACAHTLHWLATNTEHLILVGFMGAFTTFSTFLFDGHTLMEKKCWWAFVSNIAGQIVLGLCALAGGIALVQM